MSHYEALSSATRVNAEIIGFENSGMISPGHRANLVLLPNDPLTEIGAVEFPTDVMIRGYWLDEPALEAMKNSTRNSGDTSLFAHCCG